MRAALLLAALTLTAHAQWQLQPVPTTADLRGIDNVGNGIAWASGTNGTILRTTDSGGHWQLCTSPPNAEHLDFRGIQALMPPPPSPCPAAPATNPASTKPPTPAKPGP